MKETMRMVWSRPWLTGDPGSADYLLDEWPEGLGRAFGLCLARLGEGLTYPQTVASMTGAEIKSIRKTFGLSASAMGKAFVYSSPKANVAARIRPLAVGLALIRVATGLPRSPALADDASTLIGRWLVPSREQEKSRMSPPCQQHAETDVQTVPESEIEIFSCDDPAFAPQKTRILEFVKSVNEVYRAQNRPLYSETISGLCAVVRKTKAKRKTDLCNPSEKLRGAPIENLPVVSNIRASGNEEWPLAGDSYSPSSGYGPIFCFKRPAAGQVITKGCRRWGVELPAIGAPTCDCECEIVCEEDAWTRK